MLKPSNIAKDEDEELFWEKMGGLHYFFCCWSSTRRYVFMVENNNGNISRDMIWKRKEAASEAAVRLHRGMVKCSMAWNENREWKKNTWTPHGEKIKPNKSRVESGYQQTTADPNTHTLGQIFIHIPSSIKEQKDNRTDTIRPSVRTSNSYVHSNDHHFLNLKPYGVESFIVM